MLRALLQIIFNGVALLVAAKLVPGIVYTGSLAQLLLAGLVLGLLNLLVKPLVTLFSFPLIVLTLGVFYLFINGLILMLAAYFLPNLLQVHGCLPAILGGLVIAAFNWVVRALEPKRE